MRKLFFITLFVTLSCTSARADFHFMRAVKDGKNIMFNDANRQVALNIGTGVNSGFIVPPPSQFVPFSLFHLQYSIPTTFFELPARASFNIMQTLGYGSDRGWNWEHFTRPMVFISEDVTILHGLDWYAGAGAGIGFQAEENARVGTKLLFQFKLFFGYEISDSWTAEAFVMHMSNGHTSSNNSSYAFYGLGAAYKF